MYWVLYGTTTKLWNDDVQSSLSDVYYMTVCSNKTLCSTVQHCTDIAIFVLKRDVKLKLPTTPPHSRFTALFPGPPGWAGARRELLDFIVQGEISRGRYTDHLAGRHFIRTNQCPPPPSPIFLWAGCPSCRPTNSVKALKATSTFGLGRRR